MTVVEKSTPLVQSPSPTPSRSRTARREARSPEKAGRRDSDLISSATSALRRLHFKSAGGSRTKKGQAAVAVVAGQAVPKLMVMGSSTTSETTINTSTDSSNTCYTMVTVTDADQEDSGGDIMESKTLLGQDGSKSPISNSQRSRELLSEFDELFLEHEKRIQRETEKSRRTSPRSQHERKSSRKDSERSTVTVVTIEGSEDRRCSTLRDGRSSEYEAERRRSSQLSEKKREHRSSESEDDRRRSSQFLDNRRRDKMSSESEEDRRAPADGNFLRAAGSSSEKDSDDIFSSTEEHSRAGTGAPPSTPLLSTVKKDEFFSKSIMDDDAMKNFGDLVENGNYIYEKKRPRPKSERPKSSVRTIQNDIPQRTFSTNLNKRKVRGEDCSPRGTPREEKTMFPFPPRLPSRPSSPGLSPGARDVSHRRSSNSPRLEHAGTLPLNLELSGPPPDRPPRSPTAVAALTLFNLEKHEKQTSQDVKKKRHKFDSIFSMDSPSTMQTSSPPAKSALPFEFPSATSPTENKSISEIDSTQPIENPEHISHVEDTIPDNQPESANSRRRKRNDRKSISVETPIKLLEADEKISQNRRTSDVYRDLILEDKINALQNRKYSVLASDGSVKNFVSENSKEMKKTVEGVCGPKKGGRRGSEVPQRHRRVSIVQGESLRHFIFEEPDTSKQKASRNRKVSVVVENLDDLYNRKSSLVPGDTLRNLLGEEPRGERKSSIVPGEMARKFSINTLGDIVSARKFSLLPPGEIYTSQIDGKTTEIIKLKPGTKGRPLATIVVQQASFQRGSISGPSGGGEDLLDVANTFTLEELHEFDMKYGSPHHCRSQSVKTPGRSCGRPNYLCLPQQRSRVASMPNTGVEEEYYRLRHFSITGKHVVNRGDSLKSRRSRSNNSVASSNSSHSTEHLATNMGTVGSHPGSARTSAECSLASSRESSTTTVPYKVVMLGAAGVGKTSLVSQFMTSEYLHAYDTSLDEEYGEKSVFVLLDGEESELIFVDHSSGEMSPENCISTYSPQAFVVIYSVVDRASIQHAEEILQTLWKSETINSKAVILVGNKADLVRSRAVSTEEGKGVARSYDCKFIETSVGINHNVDELLVGILTQIRLKIQQSLKPRRNKSPLGSCMGKDEKSPKMRNTRLSASLRVKKLLDKVWARDSKSKSCENLHVL